MPVSPRKRPQILQESVLPQERPTWGWESKITKGLGYVVLSKPHNLSIIIRLIGDTLTASESVQVDDPARSQRGGMHLDDA